MEILGGMMGLDIDEVIGDEFKEFVRLAYKESHDTFGKMQMEDGIWDGVLGGVTVEDVKKALAQFKSGKAAGPSGLTYDVLKALDDENLKPIVRLMQECMDNRGLPPEMNRSMIRPLPKTEAGLTNLALTRPVALMEVLAKLFERVLFERIVGVLVGHNMLDLSQHGGLPGGGAQDAIRVLAEVMEDAQISGQELHVLSVDLTRGFDTLEYWSQALSWRALGMPVETTEMLMRMDMQGESEVIIGGGRTTAQEAVLGSAGRFNSERGVRQGSVGGPIK